MSDAAHPILLLAVASGRPANRSELGNRLLTLRNNLSGLPFSRLTALDLELDLDLAKRELDLLEERLGLLSDSELEELLAELAVLAEESPLSGLRLPVGAVKLER